MMDDLELDALLDEVAVQDRRRSEAQVPLLWRRLDQRRRRTRWRGRIVPIVSVAAALALGIGLGRATGGGEAEAPGAAEPAAVATGWAPTYTDLRGRAGSLLQDVVDAELGPAARWQPLAAELLWATRRLMDSPVAAQPGRLRLLGELEVVLAELLGVNPIDPALDLELLREALRDKALLRQLAGQREADVT